MAGYQPGIDIREKRRSIDIELPRNIFCCGRQIGKRRIVFIQKLVIEILVNNSTGPFFHFANVNQHSVGRIDRPGKNKIGNVIAARAITRSSFRSERHEVFAVRPAANKQPARSGKFEPFADRQKHDAANRTTCDRANGARVWKLGILPDSAARGCPERQSNGLPAWPTLYFRQARCPSAETGWKPILHTNPLRAREIPSGCAHHL
jgi:hypothetical protein